MHYDFKIVGKRPKSFENTINFPTFALVLKKITNLQIYKRKDD